MTGRTARLLLTAALLGALAACASAEDFRRADEAACTSYGFTPGTSEFASCLQRESLARRYDRPGFYGWYGGAGVWAGRPYW